MGRINVEIPDELHQELRHMRVERRDDDDTLDDIVSELLGEALEESSGTEQ
jgi:hypothetical protein